ncbi:hypothetical protein BN2127_JRS1_01630 [Bacillus cereus]|nr:hypothetical protein BN2127_JRS1_01630 [Bacillus cereus]
MEFLCCDRKAKLTILTKSGHSINNDSKKLSEHLLPTDEKLWFILNRNNPEGLIFTNDQEPIRMGEKIVVKIYMKSIGLYKRI